MSAVKRERWTEADVDALPAGEHDYFERKGGKLFDRTEDLLLAKVAKAISALANSGGGHLLLGVENDGAVDGVPPVYKGKTATRDWLEQVVPHLVDYPLADFRVHVVEPRPEASRIPPGRQVIVVDVGDSAMAPHQCMRSGADAHAYVYYRRQAGTSHPAPHFYVELLRQRLVSPVLEASASGVRILTMESAEDGVFAILGLQFIIHNVGRVAAYRWELQLVRASGLDEYRREDYCVLGPAFRPIAGTVRTEYPISPSLDSLVGSARDPTILPDCVDVEELEFGVLLRAKTPNGFTADIDRMLSPLRIAYRLATETSPGEIQEVAIAPLVDARAWGPRAHSEMSSF
jgi:hypothetical protein